MQAARTYGVWVAWQARRNKAAGEAGCRGGTCAVHDCQSNFCYPEIRGLQCKHVTKKDLFHSGTAQGHNNQFKDGWLFSSTIFRKHAHPLHFLCKRLQSTEWHILSESAKVFQKHNQKKWTEAVAWEQANELTSRRWNFSMFSSSPARQKNSQIQQGTCPHQQKLVHSYLHARFILTRSKRLLKAAFRFFCN